MITDFLKTKRSKEELKTVLEVLREFKKGEDAKEWMEIPFFAWVKLEQFQELLEHLVEEKPLNEDTLKYMKRKGVDNG